MLASSVASGEGHAAGAALTAPASGRSLATGGITTTGAPTSAAEPSTAGPTTTAAGPTTTAGQQPSDLVIASPAPGTRTASAATQISLLGTAANTLTTADIRVVGSLSGLHGGRVERYSTGNGQSFLPDTPFVTGEVVTVSTQLDIAGAPSGTWSFTIGHRLAVPGHEPLPVLSTKVAGVDHFASAPDVEPPRVTFGTGSGTAGGDFFLTPKGNAGQAGPLIVDSSGQVVWFQPLSGEEAFDLNVQQLGTQPVLTWFEGVVVGAHGSGEDFIANTDYRTIAVLKGANGFDPDLHEFQLLPDGVALITTYQALYWDLAPVGGPARGLVWDAIVQEIDVRTGLVEYEWHSLDHVGVALSVIKPTKPSNASHIFDYFHVNSIEQEGNGDLLISGRNTSAAYEIDPARAGQVVWELGGRRSSFTMGPGSTFWLQHDVRLIGTDTITMFDDEASPVRAKPAQSRALVLHLDFLNMTADVVRAIDHNPPLLGAALGNVQTLPDGDLVVQWGTTQHFSQYTPSGALVLDATLPSNDDTYRVYRYPWSGRPTTPPAVAVLAQKHGGVHVDVSWNGATGVAEWRVLAGASRRTLTAVRTEPDTGFQTDIGLPSGYDDFQVEALDSAGAVIGRSAVTKQLSSSSSKA